MPQRDRNRFGLRLIGAVVALVLITAACSKSEEKSGAAPEDKRAAPAEVTAGLRKIDALAKDIAVQAGADKTKAMLLDARIEPEWAIIEGTVKANDKDAYLSFEDNFALLKDAAKNGDPAKAAKGAAGVSKGVTDYLARYPG